MKQGAASRLARLRSWSLATRAALLGLVVVVVCAAVAPVAWWLSGPLGLAAAAAAAGVCLLGAVLALVVSHLLGGPKAALYGLLFGMALRMGIPLVFAVTIHLKGGVLARSGFLYYLILFYPVTLGVETALSLPKTDPAGRHPDDPEDAA